MAGMAIGIYKLLKSKSLDALKVDELQVMSIKLNKKIDELNAEIRNIEETINRLFEKARETKTKSEEVSIANRIKTLNQKKEMKQSSVFQLERELRAVNNLLIIKENEQDLKDTGTWDKLKKIKPEKMEEWLTKKTLDNKNRQELIENITALTSSSFQTADYDEELDEILDVIHEVKEGTINAKEASKKIKENE
ncbi:MAG: hypothetical protein DRN01_03370 [Thermoplasmata archaeon]|nr:MAG: hypothetical protein DRN01_03370 [Thermoplasmata archaeon]